MFLLQKSRKTFRICKGRIPSYKLGLDFTKEQFIAEFGHGSSFPRILVDDKLIGGCLDAYRYLEEKQLV